MYPENPQPAEPVQPVQPPIPSQTFDAGPTQPAARSRKPLLIAVGAVVALVLIGGVAVAVLRGSNVGPFKDSGLATCEAIRDDKSKASPKKDGDAKVKEAEYRKLRKLFADSRYSDIRDSGTKFVDLVWQFQGVDTNKEGALGMALVMGGQLMQSYSSLSGACANHGVVIPPLAQN
jgi:hypothetical protein